MKTLRNIVLFVIIAAVGLLMTSCIWFVRNSRSTVSSGYTYDNAKKFTAGSAAVPASKVKALDVEWVAGRVIIAYGSGSEVSFSESSASSLDEDHMLHWYLDGSTLKIRFQKSGLVIGKSEAKDLVVNLPRGMVLGEMGLDYLSSNVSIEVDADSYDLDGVSGTLSLASSGAREVELETVSGNIEMNFASCPGKLDVNSVSADICVGVPSSSGFTLKFSTVGGELDCTIPFTLSGKKYIAGDGKADFEIDSVSGKATILGN